MDDLISKSKLIDLLMEEWTPNMSFDNLLRLIQKVPNQTVDEWISVKDRLPKKVGKYLTYTVFSTDKICSDLFFKDGVWYVDNGCYDLVIGEVTHWMPLVEPT